MIYSHTPTERSVWAKLGNKCQHDTCSNISVKLHYIHCKKNYILKNRGNWQINIGSTSCFPKIFPKQKCIVVILAEGLKLKLKNICSLNISNCAQPIYQAEVKNMYCWPNKLCSKKVCTHAPEKNRWPYCSEFKFLCAGERESGANTEGWQNIITDGFPIIKVMVSILIFVFIKSFCTYYIVFYRSTVNSRLYRCVLYWAWVEINNIYKTHMLLHPCYFGLSSVCLSAK